MCGVEEGSPFSIRCECSWSSVLMPDVERRCMGAIVDALDIILEARGCGSPVGYLDRVSGALCLMPGMCIILKWYRRVFSLRLRGSVIFRRGLWSTAIVRFLHPRTKLSRAASASPSMGDSAAWLPTRVTCLQQNRSVDGQEQCF